ncbi:hypothetical protein Godav_011327 [Gossypium davidsonii]|uniref:Uncharacterized protein n=1 Tax=Gossypium davidsonii TaxID=34287 RepID=A0A7J8RAU8_GOSDV|nr:hypothetical protein [Gossypium davidsonii]
MANLNLDEGEEEAWIFKEETRLAKSTFEYCIMGCFFNGECSPFSSNEKYYGKSTTPFRRRYHFGSRREKIFIQSIAKQFGNFIGEFVDYDAKQSNWGYKSYLRIRVKIDIRKPLKQECNNVILGNKFGLGNHESNFRRENQIRQQADWAHKFDPIRGLNLEGKSVISRFSVVTEQWFWDH